jgi:3-methylfumaryl-CoA hydratase
LEKIMSDAVAVPAPELQIDPQDWIGRKESVREIIAPDRAAAFAAALDIDADVAAGRALPPGWHWLFFNQFAPRKALGADGHPKRGGFLPPVALPRRMWAGGRLTYDKQLSIGAEAVRESTIRNVESKSGLAGQLLFVTVAHAISSGGALCISEEQDIVYREAAPPGAPAPALTPAPDGAAWSEEVLPDNVLLFRYSALTSNGHRIHYDQDYARREENYPNLVVHGPLTATLLQGFATSCAERPLRAFEFRGVSPLFVDAPFKLEGKAAASDPDTLDIWASNAAGCLAMKAKAQF